MSWQAPNTALRLTPVGAAALSLTGLGEVLEGNG
jgi:hypothetical protein